MFERLNYAELDKMRDALLEEAAGKTEADEPMLELIGKISVEMESREAEARRRVIAGVGIINVLVLGSILFLGIFCQGCQTLQGVKGDIHWLTADVEHSKQ